MQSSGVAPRTLCFQVSEENATQYLTQTQELAESLRKLGHRFAIENFGIGRDAGRILAQTPMDYLKIDGSLMQSIATDQVLQEKVRVFVGAAANRAIQTIAERVENANTMARAVPARRGLHAGPLRPRARSRALGLARTRRLLGAEPAHRPPAARQRHAAPPTLTRVVREIAGLDGHVPLTGIDAQRLFLAEHANRRQRDAVLARRPPRSCCPCRAAARAARRP